jgi:aspartate/methionine/tyrosine aminotransferase
MRFSGPAVEAKESLIRQIGNVAEQVEKPYKLYFGESDLETPEFICQAAFEAMRSGHTFYTPTAGYMDLRRAIVEKFEQVHGVRYDPSEVICTAGGVMAINHAIHALVQPGDNVVIVEPGWPVFASILTLIGAEGRTAALRRTDGGFELDLDQVRSVVDSRTKVLIVNSPSNPTGWIISDAEQRALWELALEHDFVILSDEVYDRIVFDRPVAQSFANVATDKDHLVVVNSFSKTYNMTGWRLGYALTSEPLTKLMTKLQEFVVSNPAAMVQRAGIVALRDGDGYVQEIRGRYARQRELVTNTLRGIPNLSLPEPMGGFYAFPEVIGLRDSLAFAKKMLLETRVGMAPGIAFGAAGEGYMRMCFAASESVLVPALEGFKGFLEKQLLD